MNRIKSLDVLTAALRLCLCAAVLSTVSSGASAATLTNGFSLGVTEGNKQNRRTVVGTRDLDQDSGRIQFDYLDPGDVFGIYGRIVRGSDEFEFLFNEKTSFVISLDLNGYNAYDQGKSGSTTFVKKSGLNNQTDVLNGTETAAKQVKFSLIRDDGTAFHTFRNTNVASDASDQQRILFEGWHTGSYLLRVDGLRTKTAALYDITIQTTPVPLPAGLVLLLSGVAGLGYMKRSNKTA